MIARPRLPERTPREKGAPTALAGLLVIDFTRVVAGPACTQTLADFGADVIKIENPEGGDDTRTYNHAETGGESAAFLSLNRNKCGIALDFTNPAARLVARERLGRGQLVEVALFDIAMAMTSFFGTAYLISGENPGRFGNSPNGSPTVGVYEASDGPLYMACGNDRLVRRLLSEVFERP